MNATCPQDLYLDLLKRTLTNSIYFENGMRVSYLLRQMDTSQPYDLDPVLRIADHEPETYRSLQADVACQDNYRERMFGFPLSMIGMPRLTNTEQCLRQVLADGVPGDCMETGVWRGGCTILMRGVLKAFDCTDRTVWVADSFQGVPAPSHPADEGTNLHLDTKLAVDQETVAEGFRRLGLLDEQVRFLPGWFEETMPEAPVDNLALLRLDGDLYSSTKVVLAHMYDKVSPGGFVIIDDYGALEPCRRAVDEFRNERNITDDVHTVDWTCVYWRKGG